MNCVFTSSMTSCVQKTAFFSIFWFLFFLLPLLQCFQNNWVTLDVLFRARYSTATYCQHFDKLVSSLATPHYKNQTNHWTNKQTKNKANQANRVNPKLLWPRLRATLIYGYKLKYLEGSLTTSLWQNNSNWALIVSDLLSHRLLIKLTELGTNSLLWSKPQI